MPINKLHFSEITSTSDYIRDNLSSLSLPVVVSADMQTRGRGRKGKSFYSPADTGLYFSIGFEANDNFDLITPAAALCVSDSISELSGIDTDIKWVNDVYYNGLKICGIITERLIRDGRAVTITGIGINLTTEIFPEDAPVAGSLGVNISKELLRDEITNRFLAMNDNFDRDKILDRYRKKLFILGKEIRYTKNGEIFSGIAVDINSDCNLIVNTLNGVETLSSGEISIIMR